MTSSPSRVLLAAVTVSVVAACAPAGAPLAGPPDGDAARLADAGTPSDGATGDVTYYGQVRPILAGHCLHCHSPGGIGPVPFDTYENARDAAALIADYTAQRRMPPYLADNSGACQSYTTQDWLSDADIATLDTWNRTGRLEGDPATPAPTPRVQAHLTGAGVSHFDIGVDYAPNAARTDDYRCFVVNAPAGGYVTGFEVHPGNARIVHHVIAYAPADAAAATGAQALDTGEAGAGYTCFGGPGVDAQPVVLWAPGGGATTFPRGTGLQIDGTRPLVVQVHYNLRAMMPGDTDRTAIDLQIAASAIPAYFVPLIHDTFVAPPHMAQYASTFTQPLTGLESSGLSQVHVYGALPHMHTLGRDLQVDITHGDGTSECAIHVPRWDFNWQLAYWYAHPLTVRPSDTLAITCTWDTSSRDTTTTWGEGTQDEMCLTYFYVSL